MLEITGTQVTCRVTEDASSPAPAVAEAPRPTIAQEAERRRPSSVEDDPFVQQAVEIFSAKVADVRTALIGEVTDE